MIRALASVAAGLAWTLATPAMSQPQPSSQPADRSTQCFIAADLLPADLPPGDLAGAYRAYDARLATYEAALQALSAQIDDLYARANAAAGRDAAAARALETEITRLEAEHRAKEEESIAATRPALAELVEPVQQKVLPFALRVAAAHDCTAFHIARAPQTEKLAGEGVRDMTATFVASFARPAAP